MNMVSTKITFALVFLFTSSSGLTADDSTTVSKPDDWQQRLEALRSVPYLDVSPAAVSEGDTGLVYCDLEKAYDGYNFYCARRKGTAVLMDMQGKIVHRWSYRPTVDDYAILLENGDLVIVVRNTALLRINWDSEEMWRKRMPVHHDVIQADDSSFYTIVGEREEHRNMSVWFDAIAHLSEDGEVIRRWSTYDHLSEIKRLLDMRSFMDTILDQVFASNQGEGYWREARKEIGRRFDDYDYFHLNTISLLPDNPLERRDARFAQGNILVCFRNVNQIAILSRDTFRVLWAWGDGELQWPHHPTMLENGNILIFDNGIERRYSRIVEIDPVSSEVVWQYTADPAGDFYSSFRGSAQRLPNGNTLICESDNGRVFEVTGNGEVVWTWLNPDIREKRRTSLYRFTRLPRTMVERLLDKDGE
jgi:hypothetical protein